MRKSSDEEQGKKLIRYALCIVIGGILGLAVCFVFLLLASVGISLGWLGDGSMYQLTILGCVLGCFVGGLAAVRKCGARGLLIGLAVGVVYFLLLLTIGLLLFDTMTPETGGIGLLCGSLCGGAAAGLLGARPQRRKKTGRAVKR